MEIPGLAAFKVAVVAHTECCSTGLLEWSHDFCNPHVELLALLARHLRQQPARPLQSPGFSFEKVRSFLELVPRDFGRSFRRRMRE